MSYPMTWKRVVNRNGLQDGDYGKPPQRHAKRVVTDGTTGTLMTEEETKLARFDHVAARVEEYENAFKMLAGDIRRLELDAVDENAVARQIAHRLGIADDFVAAVLKEFMSL